MKKNKKKLTSSNLRSELWDTLGEVREGVVKHENAHVICKAATGIINTYKIELDAMRSGCGNAQNIKDFVGNKDKSSD